MNEEDIMEKVASEIISSNLKLKHMKNGLLKLDWENWKSAVVYGLLAMVLGGVFAVGKYIFDAGTIFGLDWKIIIDKGAMASLGMFIATVSILKNLLTTSQGKFLGVTKVVSKIE